MTFGPLWLRWRARRLMAALTTRSWRFARLWYRLHGLALKGAPDDGAWYFAFGANMHASAFRDRRGMRPRASQPGRLAGYRLRFNLEGRPRGRAAPANIEPADGAEVWGVLHQLTRRDLVRLDSTEGVPGRRYQPLWTHVEDAAGRSVEALTYIARGGARDGRPSLRYLTLLRDGARAHGLPEHWLRFLDQVTPAHPEQP